ncbi:alpha-L-rhamnosidase [Ornithinicoccus halotolerans]|uniref:alpha-L-rhamnosidase n=1 Tax=Ornithinicoccus halotolerans TaxID=1748220 RepID=UPI001294CD84|nr:alpha-L-rhamnosidase [Ornithinicoccus halotolerans]
MTGPSGHLAPAAPQALRVEHHPASGLVLGVETPSPRLSWVVPEAPDGYRQAAYQVEVERGGDARRLEEQSAEQVLVPWPDEPLASREAATLRVRVRGEEGGWSGWSDPVTVEAGLLAAEDWTARFISSTGHGVEEAAPVLVTQVEVPEGVVAARAYATAHGLYATHIDGQRVGDEQLAPGWTSYAKRLRYRTHDVTDLLTPGRHEVAVLLGEGWYCGRLGFHGERGLYGERPALLLQLELWLADGTRQVVASDASWQARSSNVLANDLYDGQSTDLRLPALGTGQDEHVPVRVLDEAEAPLERLVGPDGPPVRIVDTLPAVSVSPAGKDRLLVDFGQNVVGWVRLRVRGRSAGEEVVIQHAEVLEHGELGVRPLRSAKATDSYLCSGAAEEILEPSLTFHGFRYAEVRGAGELEASDLEAVVLSSDLVRTGWFDSSHALLNRFHENVVWGMRGNFLDVPTDCPQRDERLGWTGDIQIFAPTASFLFDCAGFLSSWLADLALDQKPNGAVPYVIPDILANQDPTGAAWGDAATVVPSVLHQRFGDAEVLRRQLPSMRAWVDRIRALAGEDLIWSGGFQFGDWLDPTAPPDNPFAAKADPDVVATAHLVRSAELVARAAAIVGEQQLADEYGQLAADARTAFQAAFVTPAGRILSDAPTVYALGIVWDLLPDAATRTTAGERLADLVRGAGYRIATGFVGTPLIMDALTDTGHVEVAHRLLLQTECPSWLYSVAMGATTVWERWDSMLPDGTINPGQMTSFNHYALGAMADWLHRRVAGLAPAEPGYRSLLVDPLPTAWLEHAEAAHVTPYGEARVAWRRADGSLHLEVSVPVGATAEVRVPGSTQPEVVGHGRHRWDVPDPVPSVDGRPTPVTVREVLADPQRWQALTEVLVDEQLTQTPGQAAERLARWLDHPADCIPEVMNRRIGEASPAALQQRVREAIA